MFHDRISHIWLSTVCVDDFFSRPFSQKRQFEFSQKVSHSSCTTFPSSDADGGLVGRVVEISGGVAVQLLVFS